MFLFCKYWKLKDKYIFVGSFLSSMSVAANLAHHRVRGRSVAVGETAGGNAFLYYWLIFQALSAVLLLQALLLRKLGLRRALLKNPKMPA